MVENSSHAHRRWTVAKSQARLALFSPSRTQQIRLERAMNGEWRPRKRESCAVSQFVARAIILRDCNELSRGEIVRSSLRGAKRRSNPCFLQRSGLLRSARNDDRARTAPETFCLHDRVVYPRRHAVTSASPEGADDPVPFSFTFEEEMERREAPGVCETPLDEPLREARPRAVTRTDCESVSRGARVTTSMGLRSPPRGRCASRRSTIRTPT